MAKTEDQYVLLPAMKDANGNQYFNVSGQPARPIGYAISASCKDIDAAWRVIETAYAPDNGLQLAFGQINPPEGKGGLVENEDGTYTVVDPPEGTNWDIWNISQTSFRATSYVAEEEFAKIRPSGDMITKAEINDFYAPFSGHAVMPSCYIFDNETNEELSVLKTDINSLVNRRIAAYAEGKLDIDEDWDTFQEELKTLGVDRYLEIYAERYNKDR